MTNLPQRLAEAKERLSQAAQGCLENRPGAAERADAAQAEVDALLRASALHPHCPPGASLFRPADVSVSNHQRGNA